MKIKTLTLVKTAVLFSFSTLLLHCSSPRQYPDNVRINDATTRNYDIKAAVMPEGSRFGALIEHQETSGGAIQRFPETMFYDPNHVLKNQIRPETYADVDGSIAANSIALRWDFLKSKHFGMNMYFHAMELDVNADILTASGQSYHLKRDSSGITPQFEAYMPINEHLRVVGSISNMFAHEIDFQTLTFSLEYAISKNVAVNLGYKKWFYDYDAPHSWHDQNIVPGQLNFNSSSDIHFTFQGLQTGLAFTF